MNAKPPNFIHHRYVVGHLQNMGTTNKQLREAHRAAAKEAADAKAKRAAEANGGNDS